MKVEIWSDFTCPYCYLGYINLEKALEQSQLKERVKIEYKSFRVKSSPSAKTDKSNYIYHIIRKENDMPNEEVHKMINQINEQAAQVGITFQFDQIEYTDTFNAHRLTKFAENQGKDREIIQLLFKKYFSRNENIGSNEVLLKIAKAVDLDEEEVDSLLCLNQYAKSVYLDEEAAEDIGIDQVPFFIFNEQFAVAGAQPIETFLEVLEEVKRELNGKWDQNEPTVEMCKTTYCTCSDCEK